MLIGIFKANESTFVLNGSSNLFMPDGFGLGQVKQVRGGTILPKRLSFLKSGGKIFRMSRHSLLFLSDLPQPYIDDLGLK